MIHVEPDDDSEHRTNLRALNAPSGGADVPSDICSNGDAIGNTDVDSNNPPEHSTNIRPCLPTSSKMTMSAMRASG